MREELRELKAQDPSFEPGRPVVTNPYALMPSDVAGTSGINLLEDPTSLDVSSLFDGCYETMVQILGRLFVHAEESEAELETLAHISVGMMFDVIEPLGSALSLLPAGRSYPGLTAGPSFRLSRGASIPTGSQAARFVFNERLAELGAYCRFLQASPDAPAVLAKVKSALDGFAASLAVEGS
jgi:hypothetical protein